MEAACIYTGDDGKTKFGTVTLPVMTMVRREDGTTDWTNVQGALTWGLAEGPGSDADFGNWHTAGQPMMSIVLQGHWEVEVGNGERRVLELGSLTVFLDQTGQGHRSRTTSVEPSIVIGVRLDAYSLADFSAQLGITP
jgi:hypothetical protein